MAGYSSPEKNVGDKYKHPEFGNGEVTNVVLYPDGDFRFYVVKFDENFVECAEEDAEKLFSEMGVL